jgi:hypothetical protein
MPQQDDKDAYPYSFDAHQPPRQPQRTRRNTYEEDESVKEEIIEEIDDALGISNRIMGCGWSLITLPFRFIGKIFGFIGDLFD